jgi:hypothetical protein
MTSLIPSSKHISLKFTVFLPNISPTIPHFFTGLYSAEPLKRQNNLIENNPCYEHEKIRLSGKIPPMTEKPSKPFKYPGDIPMCLDGQVRAATYSQTYLNGEAPVDGFIYMAQKGEFAVSRGASTHKRNLIAYIVYFLYRRGLLEDYTNAEGDFVKNDGQLVNLKQYEEISKRFI